MIFVVLQAYTLGVNVDFAVACSYNHGALLDKAFWNVTFFIGTDEIFLFPFSAQILVYYHSGRRLTANTQFLCQVDSLAQEFLWNTYRNYIHWANATIKLLNIYRFTALVNLILNYRDLGDIRSDSVNGDRVGCWREIVVIAALCECEAEGEQSRHCEHHATDFLCLVHNKLNNKL